MLFSRLHLRRIVGAALPAITAVQVKHLLRAFDEHAPGFALALRAERDRRVHAGLPPSRGDTEFRGVATWPLAGEALLLHANLGVLRQSPRCCAERGASPTRSVS